MEGRGEGYRVTGEGAGEGEGEGEDQGEVQGERLGVPSEEANEQLAHALHVAGTGHDHRLTSLLHLIGGWASKESVSLSVGKHPP